jgi:hypothetical protein
MCALVVRCHSEPALNEDDLRGGETIPQTTPASTLDNVVARSGVELPPSDFQDSGCEPAKPHPRP